MSDLLHYAETLQRRIERDEITDSNRAFSAQLVADMAKHLRQADTVQRLYSRHLRLIRNAATIEEARQLAVEAEVMAERNV